MHYNLTNEKNLCFGCFYYSEILNRSNIINLTLRIGNQASLNCLFYKMTLSNKMTVIGLTNGMIGGVILVLPLLALETGWLLILPVTIFSGFVSYYTCSLCLRHMKNYKDLDVAILHHFQQKRSFKILYDVIIIISMTILLILYFSLICQQWAGIIGNSKVIPIINALMLFPIVYVMKKYDFGTSLLAYGILSIIGYVIFLMWLLLTTQQGPKQVPAVDSNFIDMAAGLGQGFSIQTFFIPILKTNPNQKLYKKLLALTYLIGCIVYAFIGYAGTYSIVNRTSQVKPQTIEDYFGTGSTWEVVVLEIIYLIHLYSAFPEFLLIAKKRFFSIFRWPEPKDVSIKQVIYVAVTILLGLLVKLTNMSVTVIIELNGSVISFFFIYLIPIGLHLKCIYFTKKHEEEKHSNLNEEKEKQIQAEKKSEEHSTGQKKQENGEHNSDSSRQNGEIQMHQVEVNIEEEVTQNTEDSQKSKRENGDLAKNKNDPQCCCDIQYRSRFHRYGQLGFILIMLLSGVLIMVYTIVLLIKGKEQVQT